MFELEVPHPILVSCHVFDPVAIVRMDSLMKDLPYRRLVVRVTSNSQQLGRRGERPIDEILDPTSRMTEPLRFRQASFATPQHVLGPFAFGDVVVRFKNRNRTAVGVTLQRPSAGDDGRRSVPFRVNELSFPPPFVE